MANHFLSEIDKRNRRRFKESIISNRVAQATDKSYKDYMRGLKQQDRIQQKREQKGNEPMTFKEKQAFKSQQQVRLSNMDESEQQRILGQRDQMWSSIPAHLRDKAAKLAGR